MDILFLKEKVQDFLGIYEKTFATDVNVGRKIRVLSIFDFRAFLNMASLNVAAGKIDKDLLYKIMAAIMNNTYNQDEELKLEIYNAIS